MEPAQVTVEPLGRNSAATMIDKILQSFMSIVDVLKVPGSAHIDLSRHHDGFMLQSQFCGALGIRPVPIADHDRICGHELS